jgi:hypothetical protein
MYDLRTGAQKMMKHPTTGQDVPRMFMRAEKHCGPFNASAHTLFFRNGELPTNVSLPASFWADRQPKNSL